MGRQTTTILISIVANLLLIGLKFLLAGLSGSLSLRASAWHSFSDVIVSGIVLIGLVVARADRRPSRGVSRVEHAISLVVALFILYAGWDIFRDVGSAETPEMRYVAWVALAAVLSIVVSLILARYKTYVGRATDSPSLIADGYHSLIDMYSSIVVVASLLGYALGFRSLDKVAAVVVVLFILFAGYEIARGALRGLLGRGQPDAGAHPGHAGPADPGRVLRTAVPILVPVVIVLYLLSGVYVVKAGHAGVVRRFGKVTAVNVPPGLRYRLPWPIDAVSLVPLDAIQRLEVPRSTMLTGDQNLVDVTARVHFRVDDVRSFALNVSEPGGLVLTAAEAALRQTVGGTTVDALLTSEKERIQREAQERLQTQLGRAAAGLRVLSVQLLEAAPPQEVATAFLDVASAREDRSTYINEALAYQNELLPRARAKAGGMISEAEGYRAEKIAGATGESRRFLSRLGEYRKATQVTRTRLYLEAVEKALPNVRKLFLSPGVREGDLELWLGRSGVLPMPVAP
ncbi:MAG: FtsH protease activity modulator HflK [Actinobacteria bacterium]|nr:FtsH protease activity modulator HflK [Actinomycetota bacterium]